MDDISAHSVFTLHEDWGHAEIAPRDDVPAGSYGTWTITYTAGANGINVGGSLRILPPRCGRLHWMIGKVTACADAGGAALEVTTEGVYPRSYHHSVYPSITVVVYGRRIEPGETLRIVLGDTGGYNSGRFIHTQAPDFAADNMFEVFVDTIGNARFSLERHKPERYHAVAGELNLRTVAARPAQVRVSAHQPPAAGAPAAVTLTVEDRYENPVRDFTGSIRFDTTTPVEGLPPSVGLMPENHGHLRIEFPSPPAPEPVYISAYNREQAVIGTSNPLAPRFLDATASEGLHTYFGDLHVMTGQGGNESMLGGTESALLYARDDRGLDFSAVTNSGRDIADVDAALFARYHQPHRFVTMPAHEYGLRSGHKNVYTLEDDVALEGFSTWSGLWEQLRGRSAMAIAHHPNTHSETDPYAAWGAHNLDTINPEFERVIEICQNRGSFEKEQIGEDNVYFGGFGSSVQSALARGMRLGFVGGTDNHRGLPGSGRSHQSGLDFNEYVTGGLTGVIAAELTREAVFEAIWQRRCYATTGSRILLDFSLNNHVMGSEVVATDERRTMRVKVAGTTDIARAVIVRNGADVHLVPGDGRLLEFEWSDGTPLAEATTAAGWVYYYVRVVQADGHMAWSSPVWVDAQ